MAKGIRSALVTGAAGFAGSHLVEHLLGEGYEVLALDHPEAPRANLEAVAGRIAYLPWDLADPAVARLEEELRGRELTAVFHLAALASVRRSWEDTRRTLQSNSLVTLSLLQALARHPGRPRVLLVGSADEYGATAAAGAPLTEDLPLAPTSPYALGKVWQEQLGAYFARVEQLPVYLTRTFNHTGPRQGPDFVCADFARQIARIELRREEPVLRVGNLGAARDFLDVRDVVRAYAAILETGLPGVPYNVSSGRSRKISELLQTLLQLAVLRIKVEVDLSRRRPVDIPLLCGDSSRLRADTGWEPRIPIEETLRDLLEYWRARVGAATP